MSRQVPRHSDVGGAHTLHRHSIKSIWCWGGGGGGGGGEGDDITYTRTHTTRTHAHTHARTHTHTHTQHACFSCCDIHQRTGCTSGNIRGCYVDVVLSVRQEIAHDGGGVLPHADQMRVSRRCQRDHIEEQGSTW